MRPPKLTCRSYVRSGTFDILALPADMRNRIYPHILTHGVANNHVPNTVLLRTCKQIHDESRLLSNMLGAVRLNIAVDNQGTLCVDGNVVWVGNAPSEGFPH